MKDNFSGASDQLLATNSGGGRGRHGAGWLKPLEQGFDVKLTAALHGGCIRVLTNQQSGITSIAGLKGKAVGTLTWRPDRNFVSILAAKSGFDPLKDIDWRVYPADLLSVALQKGEIQAFSCNDPIASIVRDRDHLVEVTNNLAGDFVNLACCVLGIRAGLVRDERPVAAALTAAIMEAQEWVAENAGCRRRVVRRLAQDGNRGAVAAMLAPSPHHHHPVNSAEAGDRALRAGARSRPVFRPGYRSGSSLTVSVGRPAA